MAGETDGSGPDGRRGSANDDPRGEDIVGGVPACAVDDDLLPPQARRLTPLQYRNTLVAAFGDIFSGQDFPDFQDDYPTVGLANDPARLRVTTVSIDAIYASAQSAGRRIAQQHAGVRDCIAASDDTCFETLADTLGMALWRRPVDADERASLMMGVTGVAEETGTRAEQMDFLLQALLMSPNTLYRTEVGSGQGELTQLTGYELAGLLAYTLTDAPPDDELMALADGEQLYDPEVMVEQAQRLMGGDRFVDTMVEFLHDFLKLDNIHTVGKAPDLGLTQAARAALAQSAEATLRARLQADGATLMDVFAGQDFEVNPGSAPFFGVDGVADGLSTVQLSADEREGMLTHPAFLAVHSGNGNSGIIKRGVFTLKQLLGYDLPDPPDDVAGVAEDELPEFDRDATSSRELLQLTHSGQDRCNACHRVIDPAGFGFENWGPVGRFRTTEKNDVPIDASGELALGGETLSFDDGVQYMRALAESDAMRRAVLTNYFTYALGRTAGECEMRQFDEAVAMGSDQLRALAENLVLTDSFAVRQEQP